MFVRKAVNEDFPGIFLMGFDVWGEEGNTKEQHIDFCQKRVEYKYKYGNWYVLEDKGKIKSSLICYRNAFGLAPRAVGIGSVATVPEFRKQGYMAHLLSKSIFMESQLEKVDYFFLFSDIDPYVYQKHGFIILPKEFQKYDDSVAMILPVQLTSDVILNSDFISPDYF